MASDKVTRRLAAIFAADMVGYSSLMEADEEGTIARQKTHRKELIDPKIAEHDGRIVKLMGDGILVEFASVVDAVRCAVEVQQAMVAREAEVPEDRRIRYRVGINLGDIVIDGDDILGDGVNVAARLEGLAEPGGICMSRAARDQVRDRIEIALEDMGEVEVKNIARPIRAFRLLLAPEDAGNSTIRLDSSLKRYRVAILALMAVIAFGGVLFWQMPFLIGTAATKPTATANAGPSSLVGGLRPELIVLPFTNIGSNAKEEYFSDGFTEDVTTSLARVPGFLVIARNTAFTFKGKNVSAKELRLKLGVRYLLEGSVRRRGNRVRINAQLIETATGNHVWAEKFDRPLSEIFIVQDALVDRIVGSVASHLRRREGERATLASPKTLRAYDLTMRARMLFKRNTYSEVSEARELLRRAIDSDASYALAYALLGEVENYFFTNRRSDEYVSPETSKRMLNATSKAVALAPNDAYVRAVHGIALRSLKQYEAAGREAQQARKLAPNDPDVLAAVAVILLGVGDYPGVIATVKKARLLDPYIAPFVIGVIMSQAQFALGDFKGARESANFCIQRVPADARCHESLVRALGEIGTPIEAKTAVKDLLRLSPKYTVSDYIRRAKTNRNDPSAIKRWADGLRKAGLPE